MIETIINNIFKNVSIDKKIIQFNKQLNCVLICIIFLVFLHSFDKIYVIPFFKTPYNRNRIEMERVYTELPCDVSPTRKNGMRGTIIKNVSINDKNYTFQ